MQPGGTATGALESTVCGAGMRQQAGADAGTRDRPAKEKRQEGRGGQPKRRKTEAERADKLDSLVAQYRAQIFGDAKGKASSQGVAKSSIQRWFE